MVIYSIVNIAPMSLSPYWCNIHNTGHYCAYIGALLQMPANVGRHIPMTHPHRANKVCYKGNFYSSRGQINARAPPIKPLVTRDSGRLNVTSASWRVGTEGGEGRGRGAGRRHCAQCSLRLRCADICMQLTLCTLSPA